MVISMTIKTIVVMFAYNKILPRLVENTDNIFKFKPLTFLCLNICFIIYILEIYLNLNFIINIYYNNFISIKTMSTEDASFPCIQKFRKKQLNMVIILSRLTQNLMHLEKR